MKISRGTWVVVGAACAGILIGVALNMFLLPKPAAFVLDNGLKVGATLFALTLAFSRIRGRDAFAALAACVYFSYIATVVVHIWPYREAIFWSLMDGHLRQAMWGWPPLTAPMQAMLLAVPSWWVTRFVHSKRPVTAVLPSDLNLKRVVHSVKVVEQPDRGDDLHDRRVAVVAA